MYATIHHFRGQPGSQPDDWAAALHHRDVPAYCYTLITLGGLTGMVLACWPDEARAAAAAANRPAGHSWLETGSYRMVDGSRGVAADQLPRFAQVTWFDGPRSAAQVEADSRAGRDRIWPAIRSLPGIVGHCVLRSSDNATVVFGFTTSLETIESMQQAVMSTDLLPGEDPAMLTGPDRIDVHRVRYATAPVPVEPVEAGERR